VNSTDGSGQIVEKQSSATLPYALT